MLRVLTLLLACAAAALRGAAAAACDNRPTLKLYSGYSSSGTTYLQDEVKFVQGKVVRARLLPQRLPVSMCMLRCSENMTPWESLLLVHEAAHVIVCEVSIKGCVVSASNRQ